MKRTTLAFDLLSEELEVLTQHENLEIKGGTEQKDVGRIWAVDNDGNFYFSTDAGSTWTAMNSLNEVTITAPAPGTNSGTGNGVSSPGNSTGGFNPSNLPFGGSGGGGGSTAGHTSSEVGHFLMGASLTDFSPIEGVGINGAWSVEGNYSTTYSGKRTEVSIDLGVNVPAAFLHPDTAATMDIYKNGVLISSGSFLDASDVYTNGIIAPAGQLSLTRNIWLPTNAGGIYTVELNVSLNEDTGAGVVPSNKSYSFNIDVENPNLIN